jgi:hypothetical protein
MTEKNKKAAEKHYLHIYTVHKWYTVYYPTNAHNVKT